MFKAAGETINYLKNTDKDTKQLLKSSKSCLENSGALSLYYSGKIIFFFKKLLSIRNLYSAKLWLKSKVSKNNICIFQKKKSVSPQS